VEKIVPYLDVSIIIPTYNKLAYTQQCLASIALNSNGYDRPLNYEIIVVDNGSTDGTTDYFASKINRTAREKVPGFNIPKKTLLLHNPTRRLLAKSWNMGVNAAKGRIVLITNNDVIFTANALRELITCADENQQAGIVVGMGPGDYHVKPKINKLSENPSVSEIIENIDMMDEWREKEFKEPEKRFGYINDSYLPQGGFCFVVSRNAIRKVGMFDENYTFTGEDWDYFSRVRREYKIVRARHAYIAHFEHETAKGLNREYHELLCRNRFRLTEQREGCMEIFSIIMPVYNRVRSLKAAIDSVIAQTFPHWRLYVVDDGSDQWTQIKQLAHDYELASNRIWFFHLPENQGPAHARNFPLNSPHIAKGKYVAFLDSDDIWYPNHLTTHYNAHETGDFSLIYSDPDFAYRSWNAKTNSFQHRTAPHPLIKYFGEYDKDRFKNGPCYIQTSAVSVWGDLARANRFPENMRIEEDWEYFKAVVDAGGAGRNVFHIPQRTCRYHQSLSQGEEKNLMQTVIPSLRKTEADNFSISIPLPKDADSIGVVIPTHNRSESVRRAISSVRGTQCVVVDDGGSNANEVYQTCKERGVALIRSDRSNGASRSRNIGADYAKWEWIKLLDDDDILTPDWYKIMEDAIESHKDADALIFAAYIPSSDGLRVSEEIFTSQIAVRRGAFFDAGGFDTSCSWAEERDLIDRMARLGKHIERLPIPIVTRPARGGSGDKDSQKNIRPQGAFRRFGD